MTIWTHEELLAHLRDERFLGQEGMRQQAAAEIEQLRHDIDRHIAITTAQQGEIERLRGGLVTIAALAPVVGGDPLAVEMAMIAKKTLNVEQNQDGK